MISLMQYIYVGFACAIITAVSTLFDYSGF